MDFALAHNVRGVTLTRREREKGKGTKPQDSQVKSKAGHTHRKTERERGRGRGRQTHPQPCHGGKARPFVFVVNVVCGLSPVLSEEEQREGWGGGGRVPGCGTWHSSILWPFSLCLCLSLSLGIQSFVFCHINNSLLLFAPLPVHDMPGNIYQICLSVSLSVCTSISIYLPSLFDIHNFQLVKVHTFFGARSRSLIIISSSRGKNAFNFGEDVACTLRDLISVSSVPLDSRFPFAL